MKRVPFKENERIEDYLALVLEALEHLDRATVWADHEVLVHLLALAKTLKRLHYQLFQRSKARRPTPKFDRGEALERLELLTNQAQYLFDEINDLRMTIKTEIELENND